jgi:hypothetical protein
MSRQDVRTLVLPSFFKQLLGYVDAECAAGVENQKPMRLLGSLKCIAAIFKYGKREDLLPYTSATLATLLGDNDKALCAELQLTLVRKFQVKILQRVGMAFFKVKIAAWRYQRGSRILLENVNKQQQLTPSSNESSASLKAGEKKQSGVDDEEEEKIPFEIEEIIEQIFTALKDKDTIVRWSAAKGIGRIANRLPKLMAEDIFANLIDMFAFVEDDSAWHGKFNFLFKKLCIITSTLTYRPKRF